MQFLFVGHIVQLAVVIGLANGLPPLPPGVRIVSGPTYNSTTKRVDFEIAAPQYQEDKGQWGGMVELIFPTTVNAAVQAGENATSNPKAFAGVKSILLVLPVAAGPSDSPYGDGLALVAQLGYQNSQGAVVVKPQFTTTPWFCDGSHPSSQPVRQAAYIHDIVLPLARMFCPAAADGTPCLVDLIGFSKSGWGALSLLLSNSSVYHRAAIWDAPTMLSLNFCQWMLERCNVSTGCLWDMMSDIGDCNAWAECAPDSLVPQAPQALKDMNNPRLFLSGQHYFGSWPNSGDYAKGPGAPFNHTVGMHARLTSFGIAHVYNDNLDPGKHEWSDVWLKPALEFLSTKR